MDIIYFSWRVPKFVYKTFYTQDLYFLLYSGALAYIIC